MATPLKLRPINARRGKPAKEYQLPPGRYWVNSQDNILGFALEVSEGPYGLAVRVEPFILTPSMDLTDPDARHLGVCQYRQTPKAQAFRRWYLNQATPEDIELLGPEYQRK